MKISSVETDVCRVPMPQPLVDSTIRLTEWELVISKVRTDTNLTGVGWSYTLGTGGAAVRSLIQEMLVPHVVGQDPFHIERINERLWWAISRYGSGMTTLAVAPLDIAIWDVLGKAVGRPLWELLGGCRERIPAYGSGINFHLDIDELRKQMQGFLDQGFRAVKLKVGKPDAEEDVERVRAVRQLVGPKVALMVDANLAWTAAEGSSAPPYSSPSTWPGSRSRCPPRTSPATRGCAQRSGSPSPSARRSTRSTSSPSTCAGAGSTSSRPMSAGWVASASGSRSPISHPPSPMQAGLQMPSRCSCSPRPRGLRCFMR